MPYQVRKYKLTGLSPLLMHNGQMVDQLNQFSRDLKKISGKRSKTESDYEQMAKLEWFGGLYVDEEERPCLSGDIIEATFVEGAKKRNKGKTAKAAIYCNKNALLMYNGNDGKKINLDKMWESKKYHLSVPVRIGTNKVIRTRPQFQDWSATIELNFDDGLLNAGEVFDILKICGEQIGLCDWRPKFGRFTVEEVK